MVSGDRRSPGEAPAVENLLAPLVEEVRGCQRCPLARTRTRAVPGEGPLDAKIMFIGEAPGYHEDQQGRPFVGAAGMLLEEALRGIGLTRADVYITNILKCRPPNNRDPEPQEMAACRDYLERQLAILRPPLVVTLGRFSMARFFPPGPMRALHGRTARHGALTAYALYHPAAALRTPAVKAVFLEDFQRIPRVLAEAEATAVKQALASAAAAEIAEPTPTPEQLSLF
jgi:DNA polymerase